MLYWIQFLIEFLICLFTTRSPWYSYVGHEKVKTVDINDKLQLFFQVISVGLRIIFTSFFSKNRNYVYAQMAKVNIMEVKPIILINFNLQYNISEFYFKFYNFNIIPHTFLCILSNRRYSTAQQWGKVTQSCQIFFSFFHLISSTFPSFLLFILLHYFLSFTVTVSIVMYRNNVKSFFKYTIPFLFLLSLPPHISLAYLHRQCYFLQVREWLTHTLYSSCPHTLRKEERKINFFCIFIFFRIFRVCECHKLSMKK